MEISEEQNKKLKFARKKLTRVNRKKSQWKTTIGFSRKIQ